MSFFDYTDEDLQAPEKLIFNANEIVKFQCLDHYENNTNKSISLKCKVLSGPHAGKQFSVHLSSRDNEASRKAKGQFLRAFWTADEIKSRTCNKARLIGRYFTAKCKHGKKLNDQGQPFQNWEEFQDLGPSDTSQPQAAAPVQAAPHPQQGPSTPQPAPQAVQGTSPAAAQVTF